MLYCTQSIEVGSNFIGLELTKTADWRRLVQTIEVIDENVPKDASMMMIYAGRGLIQRDVIRSVFVYIQLSLPAICFLRSLGDISVVGDGDETTRLKDSQ